MLDKQHIFPQMSKSHVVNTFFLCNEVLRGQRGFIVPPYHRIILSISFHIGFDIVRLSKIKFPKILVPKVKNTFISIVSRIQFGENVGTKYESIFLRTYIKIRQRKWKKNSQQPKQDMLLHVHAHKTSKICQFQWWWRYDSIDIVCIILWNRCCNAKTMVDRRLKSIVFVLLMVSNTNTSSNIQLSLNSCMHHITSHFIFHVANNWLGNLRTQKHYWKWK